MNKRSLSTVYTTEKALHKWTRKVKETKNLLLKQQAILNIVILCISDDDGWTIQDFKRVTHHIYTRAEDLDYREGWLYAWKNIEDIIEELVEGGTLVYG